MTSTLTRAYDVDVDIDILRITVLVMKGYK